MMLSWSPVRVTVAAVSAVLAGPRVAAPVALSKVEPCKGQVSVVSLPAVSAAPWWVQVAT